ncbi:Uncharacterised protein [Starkeya nomas]|uniref:Uncharacterized protein n=2 Tax=Alphaproteobacteria TaxID=28211 RepID=A0A5S9PG06_9HYPH|nr:hypothetical protein L288_17605 [Sphingobium quisquiliarum P25]CAA0102698.1 Uncharacterised protein [Starkeya nomas]
MSCFNATGGANDDITSAYVVFFLAISQHTGPRQNDKELVICMVAMKGPSLLARGYFNVASAKPLRARRRCDGSHVRFISSTMRLCLKR